MQRDDEAVSPVIATVLLLAITVLLTSMVFLMMSSTLDGAEKSPPRSKVSVRALSNGYHVITITYLDQSLDPGKIDWSVMNESGENRYLLSGHADDADVYGTVGSKVSFHDRDAGWSVSTGDYFVIDCNQLNCGDGSHYFQVTDSGTDTLLFRVKLPVTN